jgi:hypothetical protein
MVAAIRPQVDLLRAHQELLNDARPRADVILFLPFRRWVETDQCPAVALAAALTAANVQYEVVSEDSLSPAALDDPRQVLLVESQAVLTPAERAAVDAFQESGGRVVAADDVRWLARLTEAVRPASLSLSAPPSVRAVMYNQPLRAVIHLYNLNIERLSSFEDKVTAAANIRLTAGVPFPYIRSVGVHSADAGTFTGPLKFISTIDGADTVVEFTLPQLETSAIIVIDGKS